MRSLAIARFRLLNAVRSCDWVFGIALLCAVVPTAVATSVAAPASWYMLVAEVTLRSAPQGVIAAYFLHVLLLAIAAQVLGQTATTWGEVVETNDLLDTAPVDPRGRVIGDSVGIFATLLVVHVATLPVLLFAAALTALPAWVVAVIEVAILAVAFLFSVIAASMKRSLRTAWGRSRSVRGVAVMIVLAVFSLAITTRFAAFREAVWAVLGDPSPRAWSALEATVYNPTLLALLLAAVFLGGIAYFYLHAVRPEATR